jgi:hypothetical protein
MQSKWIIIMPIVGSIALVLLFYFLKILYYFLVALLALNGIVSVVFVFYPFIQQFLECYFKGCYRTHLSYVTYVENPN